VPHAQILSSDFDSAQLFLRRRDSGLLTTINHLLVMAAPEQAGRVASPSAGVIDSRSVKTTDSDRCWAMHIST
jgi:hypothetical protein